MDPRRGEGDDLPDAHNMMEDSDDGDTEAVGMFADAAPEAPADWVSAAEETATFLADDASPAPEATPAPGPPPAVRPARKDTGRVRRTQIDDLFDRAKKLRGS